MTSMKKHLYGLETRYRKIWEKVKDADQFPMEGSLILTNKRVNTQLYLQTKDEVTGRFQREYLGKDKEHIARALAQKTYDRKVLRLMNRRIAQLSKITRDFDDDEVDRLFTDLDDIRKGLIEPVEVPYEQMLDNWTKQKYIGKGYQEDTNLIPTNKGELVRSKSEKILADRFLELGIPYKYECPLVLNEGITLYPDFTFLSPHTRQEVYWEHFGMMDNPEYARRAWKKMGVYQYHGLFIGERLIITYETSKDPLDFALANVLIEKYLL